MKRKKKEIPLQDYDLDEPEQVDEYAREVVEKAELDDEDCERTPNDFEECVKLVKERVLTPEPTYGTDEETGFDEDLDELIFRRCMKRLGVKLIEGDKLEERTQEGSKPSFKRGKREPGGGQR